MGLFDFLKPKKTSPNLPPQEYLRREIVDTFIEFLNERHSKNKFENFIVDYIMHGTISYGGILKISESLKESVSEMAVELKISEKEVLEVIEETTNDFIDKYLKP